MSWNEQGASSSPNDASLVLEIDPTRMGMILMSFLLKHDPTSGSVFEVQGGRERSNSPVEDLSNERKVHLDGVLFLVLSKRHRSEASCVSKLGDH